MDGIDKHAAFYRAYLPAERSLVPMTIALATIVALWFFVYLVIAVGPQTEAETVRPGSHVGPDRYAVGEPLTAPGKPQARDRGDAGTITSRGVRDRCNARREAAALAASSI